MVQVVGVNKHSLLKCGRRMEQERLAKKHLGKTLMFCGLMFLIFTLQ